nr:FkbM family methyltransferase [Micromonospora sp. DSM 115978]
MNFSPADFARSRPALYGRAVATKDLVWQAKVAVRAARSAPVVLDDEFGIRLLVEPWQRKSVRHLLRRPGDRPAFEIMKSVVPVGGTVFDVGANAGVYSVHAARLVGPGGRVHAFEPVPATGDRLNQTLALN